MGKIDLTHTRLVMEGLIDSEGSDSRIPVY